MRNTFGFLAGLGAGIGMGMLLAPRAGRETRSMVSEKASDGAAYLRERGGALRDAAADAIREGTRTVNRGSDAVRAAMDAGTQAFRDSMQS